MRIDSCRNCGNEMMPVTDEDLKCITCETATKFICIACHRETDIQYHLHHTKIQINEIPIISIRK